MRRLLFLFLSVVVTACSTIDCPVQNTVSIYYAVKKLNGEVEVTDTLKDTLSIWTRRSNGTDTLLYNQGVNTTKLELPVSYSHPEDVWVFRIADTSHVATIDTVWIKKNDIPHFESVDCSAHFFHELTAVRSTHLRIDTILINNPSVTYDPLVVNLHIRFKARR